MSRGATILVVDDEEMVRKLILTMLRKEGYQCLAAVNGLEAIAVFRSNASIVELVITDLRMPVMGGAEAVARLRETRPDIPIICMSGYTEETVPRGAQFLAKPFQRAKLLAAVKRVLP